LGSAAHVLFREFLALEVMILLIPIVSFIPNIEVCERPPKGEHIFFEDGSPFRIVVAMGG
jgi:hypothetical protein